MVNVAVVQLLIFLILSGSAVAKTDRASSEVYLGEKKLDGYAERYQPLIFQDPYLGKMAFEDELFFQNFFRPYGFSGEGEVGSFLRSELQGALTCPNEVLGEHFETLRYSYRLITLSYLLEAQWSLRLASDHLRLKNGCDFDLQKWVKGCQPKTEEMKKFVGRLKAYNPKFDEGLPPTYKKEDWWKEYSSGKLTSYPQYRFQSLCKGKCVQDDIPAKLKQACGENQKLMDLVCSEIDDLMGLSTQRDAYYLIGQSNIINTYNKRGEATGCLRRFSEVLAHREVKYPALTMLFPVLQSHLREKYQERFLQGRVFFYGASKEFEDKGLADVFVPDQSLKITAIAKEEPEPAAVAKAPEVKPDVKKPEPVVAKAPEPPKKKPVVEIKGPQKSAFLQAAEVRMSQNLPRVEVDMLKLRYDYVFTLNMMNTLTERLKSFMTREALEEMVTYDKLGTSEGPVPLMFIKFMIDMQEHQGLWNLLSVLGDKFYVSNEIDAPFNPLPEYIQLVNNESTGRQWQIYILRP